MTTKRIAKGQLETRAQAAWLMNGSARDRVRVTYTWESDGKQYVVLDGYTRRLAVYRVRAHDGFLRAMKRWPACLPKFDASRPQKATTTFFEPVSAPKVADDPFVDDPFAEEPEPVEEFYPPWRTPGTRGPAYIPATRQKV